MASYIGLTYWQLAAASVFVFINAGLSVIFGLRVHRSLLVAALRMTVQLALMGLVLTTLFSIVSPLWTGIAALVMVLFCRARGGTAAGAAALWLVVLRVGYRLHDDVVGSSNGLRVDHGPAAEFLV